MEQAGPILARCAEPAAQGEIAPRGTPPERFANRHLKVASIPAMIHEMMPVGALQCNCSIFGDETTREAVVIDPGDEIDRIQAVLQRHGLTVKWIVITHAHIDHIGGAGKLQALTGAPVYMNEADYALVKGLAAQASWLGMPEPQPVSIDVGLRDGDRLNMAGANFDVLHTPGHTQGSVCLLLADQNKLIAGDTLFYDSIGRTDLPGGDYTQILRSIKTKLLALDDETKVICGHGQTTTIGRERMHNYFVSNL